MSAIEVGDLLYEYTVKFTGMTEYGVSLESLMAGEAAPPMFSFPLVGWISVVNSFIVVDFPAPFGPKNPKT